MKPYTLLLSVVLLLSLYTLPGCTNKCKRVNCPVNGSCDPETGACMIDYCKTANCGAHGTCNPTNGLCKCENGYQGAHCDTMWSTKFLNTTGWTASDNTTASTAGTPLGIFTYAPTLTATGAATVHVSGMSGFSDSQIDFALTSSTTFTSNGTDAAGRVYTGSGNINGNTLTVNYTVTFTDATYDVVTGTWRKN
jgi:hypothetical protein